MALILLLFKIKVDAFKTNMHKSPIEVFGLYASVISLFPLSGGYGGRATPDPISNSEVKPACADGTAGLSCGRVGRCRSYLKAPQAILGGLFFCVNS